MVIGAAPLTDLLERDAELAALRAAIEAAAAGSGQVVVVEGEAGIGKSSLLASAVETARGAGLRVLRARGTELERQYPWGVALGLFGPLVRDRTRSGHDLFAGPATAAARLFGETGGDGGAGDAPTDAFATIHALHWLLVNAADREPLLIAVDDVQWADEASVRLLHYLAQRADELAVTLVVAFRSGEAAPDVAAEALRTCQGAVRLHPSPLSEPAVGRLLERVPGLGGSPARRRELWEATRGNPLFLTELVRDRARPGEHAGDEASGGDVERDGDLHLDRAIPERISGYVEARIARLDPSATRVAEAIAVLGDEANLRRAGRLAEMPDGATAVIVRDLARTGILDASGPLAFVHPIVRSAVYGAVPAVARAQLHRQAALLLADEQARVGVVGAQLLEAEPAGDARVVELLREAAAEASSRGQPGVAARLLARALDEPPPQAQATDVLLALARAEALAGAASAVERFEAVIDRTHDPRRRAELRLELGHALITGAAWPEAARVFEQGLRELATNDGEAAAATAEPVDAVVAEEDVELRDKLEAGFVSAAWVGIDRHAEAEAVVDRIVREERLGSVHRGLAVWSAFQRSTVVSASADELGGLVRRAIAEVPVEQLVTEGQTVEVAAGVLVATDALEAEIDLLTRAIAAAEDTGSVGKVGVYTYCRAWPFLYTGRLTDAIADAQASLRVADLGAETFLPATRSVLSMALLERGDLEAAAQALELDPERWGNRVDYDLLVPVARARVALARGDGEGALAHLETSERFTEMMGFRAPVPPDWRIWKAHALVQLGRRAEAREVAAEGLQIARAWGARWTLGCALRVAGLAEGGPGGIELIRESAALLESSAAQLERARTLAELGAALRRLGRPAESRETLMAAMELAHRLGALALLERSRDELVAAGSRPRRYTRTGLDALTPSETRVARLAAQGRTNREIAQALFVTPKAVEYHLANAYPKLGIASRHQLRELLAREAGAA